MFPILKFEIAVEVVEASGGSNFHVMADINPAEYRAR
jgi:hypothetical protein